MIVKRLSKIAEATGIENIHRFRNEIVEEYKEVLESLDSIDSSIVNKNINMIPVYKINEGFFNKKLSDNEFKKIVNLIKSDYLIPIIKKYNTDPKLKSKTRKGIDDFIKHSDSDTKEILKDADSLGKFYKSGVPKYECIIFETSVNRGEIIFQLCTGSQDLCIAITTIYDIADELKNTEIKNLMSKIGTGDGDEGCIYITLNTKECKKYLEEETNESYAIDLDSLKYVVESEQCSLEEAIQKIKDINYIGDTYDISCVLPKGFNESMSLEQFTTLYDTLTEARIQILCTEEVSETEFVNELARKDWKEVGKHYKYSDRFRFNTLFKNFSDIMKNMLNNPQKTGNFETIRLRLLKMVDKCKTVEEVEYFKRDLNAGIAQLTALKNKKPEISKGIDDHIKWLKTDYVKALNNKAKELKSKK